MEKSLSEKIKSICESQTPVKACFEIIDNSVQAELRLMAHWQIDLPVDHINYPKALTDEGRNHRWQLSLLRNKIDSIATLANDEKRFTLKISNRTKSGPIRRAEAKEAFENEVAKEFLEAYRKVTRKHHISQAKKQITDLQEQQKTILPMLRQANSDYVTNCRAAKAAQRQALAEGRFWEVDRDLLKDYFHPPFTKNYLADVSKRWRAALFLEVELDNYLGYNSLTPTGHAYLCGIDDNGDEWGHYVDFTQNADYAWPPIAYDTTVEDAMGVLFGIAKTNLTNCHRQGDLLFCSAEIPPRIRLEPQPSEWTVRESHTITSPSLNRNGQWLVSDHDIVVNHTSHPTLTLPAGSYRLYTLQESNAD